NSVNPILDAHQPTPLPTAQPPRILVPAAYYLHKNLEIVPAVAAALKRMGRDAIFQLTLPEQSGEWAAIARQATELGVADRVVTLGSLPLAALAEAYRSTRAVYLPTLREVSTAVYPEAFHFRRPIVTSDLDFARELCGQAALFIPPLDPERTAKGLVE